MVVHLAEELIEAFLSDKRTQTFVSCNLMDYCVIYISDIDIVRKYNNNLIVR